MMRRILAWFSDLMKMPLEDEVCWKERKVDEDRISALPDDLLVKIVSLVPVEYALRTRILSKRWRFIWTMVPRLDYSSEYVYWNFVDKSMQLHRAPVLETLLIKLGKKHNARKSDVGKWVTYAVERRVREIELQLGNAIGDQCPPDGLYTCKTGLYTCKTLVKLTLSNNILIDVPSYVCLPSLQYLKLFYVEYKDQDSHVRLLSSCPVLKDLSVVRHNSDEVTRFSVRVPSLQKLAYRNYGECHGGSLVIDSPGLSNLEIYASAKEDCSIQNMPHLDKSHVKINFNSHQNQKLLLTSFSSVVFLELCLWSTKFPVAYGSEITFSRLIELKIRLSYSTTSDWLESLMLLLDKAPKLKVLMIDSVYHDKGRPLSWNQPSSVPGCLLSRLEIFEWNAYKGRREEKRFVAYILANSKCLKMAGISPESYYRSEKEMREELKSMYRASASSQLMFSSSRL